MEDLDLDPEPFLVTQSQIAKLLDKPRNQVSAWRSRRKNSGFPEPATTYQRNGKEYDLYLWPEVEEWYKNYVPKKGGAPVGNQNATGRRRA